MPESESEDYQKNLLKIKQVLLDSCSSKRMQSEDKHEALYQSSQARTDPEASKQYSDLFPLISFKSQKNLQAFVQFALQVHLIESLSKLSIAPICTGCLLGKFDRRPFRPTTQKAGSVCEKVHMDIKGPMDMMSIGKHLYFPILVDDNSGLTVAYPMQKKSDALKCYRGFAEQA